MLFRSWMPDIQRDVPYTMEMITVVDSQVEFLDRLEAMSWTVGKDYQDDVQLDTIVVMSTAMCIDRRVIELFDLYSVEVA